LLRSFLWPVIIENEGIEVPFLWPVIIETERMEVQLMLQKLTAN
jgi:hypothetical protein